MDRNRSALGKGCQGSVRTARLKSLLSFESRATAAAALGDLDGERECAGPRLKAKPSYTARSDGLADSTEPGRRAVLLDGVHDVQAGAVYLVHHREILRGGICQRIHADREQLSGTARDNSGEPRVYRRFGRSVSS